MECYHIGIQLVQSSDFTLRSTLMSVNVRLFLFPTGSEMSLIIIRNTAGMHALFGNAVVRKYMLMFKSWNYFFSMSRNKKKSHKFFIHVTFLFSFSLFDCFRYWLVLSLTQWLTLIHHAQALLCMQRHLLSLTCSRDRGHQVRVVGGNGVEMCAGGKGGGLRVSGGRDSCHTVTNAPPPASWVHTQRPGLIGVGWCGVGDFLTTQLPQSCHSGCHRASSSGLGDGGLPRSAPPSLTDFWINCEEKLFTFSRVKMLSEDALGIINLTS